MFGKSHTTPHAEGIQEEEPRGLVSRARLYRKSKNKSDHREKEGVTSQL